MSAIGTQLPPQATYTDEPVFRLTVEQYHSLIEQGKLTTDDPVELVEGVLAFKMPKKPKHRITNERFRRVVERLLPPGWSIHIQEPITLADGEPEPDASVFRGKTEDYSDRHPGPEDLALVVEVADSTLSRDRGTKLRSYARAGIAVYWIVNLIDQTLEIYTAPTGPAAEPTYQHREILAKDAQATLVIAGQSAAPISVAAIFPD